MDWFLYDNGLRHERVKCNISNTSSNKFYCKRHDCYSNSLHKKWSFPLRIYAYTEQILDGKLHFLSNDSFLLVWQCNSVYFLWAMKPTLKSCSCPIHQPGEIKNSYEPPAGRNFFLQLLCLKRYTIKRFKKTSSWYNKNVTLYIFIYNFYVQFLCWFIVIW